MANTRKSPSAVYVLQHRDAAASTTLVLGVYADLQDANDDCLAQAARAGVFLERRSSTSGPDTQHLSPVEPVRWDTAEGISCWVEEHAVVPNRVVQPAARTMGPRE